MLQMFKVTLQIATLTVPHIRVSLNPLELWTCAWWPPLCRLAGLSPACLACHSVVTALLSHSLCCSFQSSYCCQKTTLRGLCQVLGLISLRQVMQASENLAADNFHSVTSNCYALPDVQFWRSFKQCWHLGATAADWSYPRTEYAGGDSPKIMEQTYQCKRLPWQYVLLVMLLPRPWV